MSSFFGKKKIEEKTFLVVMVESSSVAYALVRVTLDSLPKLFAEKRVVLPIKSSLSGVLLLRETQKAVHDAVLHASLIVARVRHSLAGQNKEMGTVEEVVIFLSPPWSTCTSSATSLSWEYEPMLTEELHAIVENMFGSVPVYIRPACVDIAKTIASIFSEQKDVLLCAVTGEVSEFMFVSDGVVLRRATIPSGYHALARTLQSHAGFSEAEAHSVLQLAQYKNSTALGHLIEPFSAVANNFREHVSMITSTLLYGAVPSGVMVVAPPVIGVLFAHILSEDEQFHHLFKEDSTIRVLHSGHLTPHITPYASTSDIALMAGTLGYIRI